MIESDAIREMIESDAINTYSICFLRGFQGYRKTRIFLSLFREICHLELLFRWKLPVRIAGYNRFEASF